MLCSAAGAMLLAGTLLSSSRLTYDVCCCSMARTCMRSLAVKLLAKVGPASFGLAFLAQYEELAK